MAVKYVDCYEAEITESQPFIFSVFLTFPSESLVE